MSEEKGRGRRERAIEFFRKLAIVVGVTLGLSLVVWLFLCLKAGRLSSPSDVFFWSSVPLFGFAAVLIFLDMGSTFAMPVQILREKKDRGKVLDQARARTEKGFSYTLLLFIAGLIMMLLSILTGNLFGA